MTIQQNGHHLILGELVDIITGKTIPDTHDERYRQSLARRLIGPCGFDPKAIEKGVELIVSADERRAKLRVDFLVTLDTRVLMVIKYAPGSLVTRWKSAIALSRIIRSYQIPRVVVTNGEDADILDGATGKCLDRGLNRLPTRKDLKKLSTGFSFTPVPQATRDLAFRIVYAFEVDGACPCDTDICRLEFGDSAEVLPS